MQFGLSHAIGQADKQIDRKISERQWQKNGHRNTYDWTHAVGMVSYKSEER